VDAFHWIKKLRQIKQLDLYSKNEEPYGRSDIIIENINTVGAAVLLYILAIVFFTIDRSFCKLVSFFCRHLLVLKILFIILKQLKKTYNMISNICKKVNLAKCPFLKKGKKR